MGIDSLKYLDILIIGSAISSLAAYVGERIVEEYRMEREIRREGLTDSSGIIRQVTSLKGSSLMDNERIDQGTSPLEILVKATKIMERMLSRYIKYTFTGNKPTFIRVYLGQPQNGERNVRVELIYDDGVKTGTSRMKIETELEFFRSINFLRRRGYSIGLMN